MKEGGPAIWTIPVQRNSHLLFFKYIYKIQKKLGTIPAQCNDHLLFHKYKQACIFDEVNYTLLTKCSLSKNVQILWCRFVPQTNKHLKKKKWQKRESSSVAWFALSWAEGLSGSNGMMQLWHLSPPSNHRNCNSFLYFFRPLNRNCFFIFKLFRKKSCFPNRSYTPSDGLLIFEVMQKNSFVSIR